MFATMLLITGVVASTAIRIEWYNHAVGGFLPRPQPPSMEGNEVKWRVGHPDFAEEGYRRELAYARGLELSDEKLKALPVTAEQQEEIDRIRYQSTLDAEFRALVSSMGLLQYLLVPLGILCSVFAIRRKTVFWTIAGVPCLVVNLITCGLMIYREYFPSLGW